MTTFKRITKLEMANTSVIMKKVQLPLMTCVEFWVREIKH